MSASAPTAAKYTLYGHPNTASTCIRWILNELAPKGVTYDFKKVDFENDEQKTDTYLTINHQGRVPTLIVDGKPVTESVACALVLGERHALEQPIGSAGRNDYLSTSVYVANVLLPALRDWFYADDNQLNDLDLAHGVRTLALARITSTLAEFNKRLGTQAFLCSTEAQGPTAIDFVFAATLNWDTFMNRLAEQHPNVNKFKLAMRSRKSWATLCSQEPIEGDLMKEFQVG